MRARLGGGSGPPQRQAHGVGARVKGGSTQAPTDPPQIGTRPRRKLREDALHEQIADLLLTVVRPPAMWTCFPAGNAPLPRAYAVKLARMGLKRGWPDFLIVHGRAYGIELKTDTGRLSKSRIVAARGGRTRLVEGQDDVIAQLRKSGMPVAVCRSADDVMTALREWQIPMLAARIAA